MILLAAASTAHAAPALWTVLPFVLLLLCIALMPLLAARFWEHHYPKIAVGLGMVTVGYYLLVMKDTHALQHAAAEYISFMALVGSLYVISGGIKINVKGEATPMANTIFLAVGAILSNLIGTTGASMLLIRPWIRSNKYRITGLHIVMFIFIVSNCGGCLTPIGDPPLFIGFLRGVPFWWVLEHCWEAWVLCVGLLLAVFYVLDTANFRRAPKEVRDAETHHEEWTFGGLHNLVFLAVVLGAVFIPPEWNVGGVVTVTALVMLAAAVASWFTTSTQVHEANDFTFHPVKEVGFLFIGIFLTMIPALQLLGGGDLLRLDTPLQFYFASGTLSAFLDNAPTYLAFLAAEMGHYHLDVGDRAQVLQFVREHPAHLIAVSLGAVFFGAGTYIGNGPNFMVKSISEKAKVRTPSFIGYIVGYSLPILLPVLCIVGWVMLRGK
jgi:Na+/H+ antiporter NhaD/arsenite permease-like protein